MRGGAFRCRACDEETLADETPPYCPHCGWDGLNFDNLEEDAA